MRTLTLTILAFNVTYGAAWSVLVLWSLERVGMAHRAKHLATVVMPDATALLAFTVAWTSARFRDKNPVLYKALIAALKQFRAYDFDDLRPLIGRGVRAGRVVAAGVQQHDVDTAAVFVAGATPVVAHGPLLFRRSGARRQRRRHDRAGAWLSGRAFPGIRRQRRRRA